MIRTYSWILRLGLALAAFVLAFRGNAHASSLRLLTPSDGAIVHSPKILVVLTVAPTTRITVQLDGRKISAEGSVVPGDEQDLHHLLIPVDEGRHQIRFLESGSERNLGDLSLVYIPSSSLRTATAKEDQPYYFHTREREGLCKACHSLPETFETLADKPLAPAGKVCGACHPSVESGAYLHGPVAVYECFKCHASEYDPSRFRQKTSQAASCSSCHQDFLTRILGGSKHVHGPVAAGVCIVCHDPHSSSNKVLAVESTQRLCAGCHAGTLPLPLDKGLHGKLACTKCHDPHGSQADHLLSAPGNQTCKECHPKVAEGAGHPIPGHPVEAPHDPNKPGTPMTCRSCHDPHGLKDIARADIRNNENLQRHFCRRCHY